MSMGGMFMQIWPIEPVALWNESGAEGPLAAVCRLALLCRELLEGIFDSGALVGAGGRPAEGGGVGRGKRKDAGEGNALNLAGGLALKPGSVAASG